MLRIADPNKVPLNSIIVCASCETGVYVVIKQSQNRGPTIKYFKSLNRNYPTALTQYHIAWCARCKCELQLNHKILYIPPGIIDDVINQRMNLGQKLMAFDR